MDHFKMLYACPSCGRAIAGEQRSFFVCPKCGRALCRENEIRDFDDNYCGNCGAEITSAKKEALALAWEKRLG